MKKNSVSIYNKEKWWKSNIDECSLTDEHQIWVYTLKTFLKTI